MSGVVLFILILGFASNLSVALKCYVCNGLGTGCRTEFEDTKQECGSSESHRCQVSRTENNRMLTAFSRSCIAVSLCNDGCLEASKYDTNTNGCQECCDTDLCNTGNSGVLFPPVIHQLVVCIVMAVAMSAIMSK
ncbi:uncharacterized protein [Ptychodera flava]|uniref:uncharacterized protein n=1 Tax=Ptychodera flava TaxID=63121 RepID=UPI00396A0E67